MIKISMEKMSLNDVITKQSSFTERYCLSRQEEGLYITYLRICNTSYNIIYNIELLLNMTLLKLIVLSVVALLYHTGINLERL